MTGSSTSPPLPASVITLAAPPVWPPGTGHSVLCVYCRTEKFVYWPSASRLRLADCPGCQQRPYAGWHLAAPGATAGAVRWP